MEKVVPILIEIFIPVLSIFLTILPFWFLKKKLGTQNIKWWHLVIAFLISLILVVGLYLFISYVDSSLIEYFISNKVHYNYDLYISSLEFGTIFAWLTLIILITLGPFFITKYLRKRLNLKKGLLLGLLSLLIFVLLAVVSLVLIAWGVGTAFQNLDGSNVF